MAVAEAVVIAEILAPRRVVKVARTEEEVVVAVPAVCMILLQGVPKVSTEARVAKVEVIMVKVQVLQGLQVPTPLPKICLLQALAWEALLVQSDLVVASARALEVAVAVVATAALEELVVKVVVV